MNTGLSKSQSFSEGGPYIIGFGGTESAGKSAALEVVHIWLKILGYQVKLLEEGSRKALRLGMKINQFATVKTQQWILDDLEFQLDAAIHEGHDVILTDRHFVDNAYGYWARVAETVGGIWTPDKIGNHLNKWGIEKTVQYSDFIFDFHTFPIKSDLMQMVLNDGERSCDADFREDCDTRIQAGIKELFSAYPSLKIAHHYPPFEDEITTVPDLQQRKSMAIHFAVDMLEKFIMPQIEHKLEGRYIGKL